MMSMKTVNIIQTVNYIESYEHAGHICRLILNSPLDGIRVNLCKYRKAEIERVIKCFIRLFFDSNIQNIYLDIPYPIDKARVYGLNGRKDIIKNNKYIIRKGSNENVVKSCGDNEIKINCNKIEIKQDLIFYGDGEGAFKVIDVDSKSIKCIALNDFYIINGKSISCGYYLQDKEILIKILESIGEMNVSLLIPFVENSDEIINIKYNSLENISLIAKIETDCGIKNIESIAKNCDGILIGRGDLALYSDLRNLIPNLQTAVEKVRNKKLIFCTGILQNFNDIFIPARAELFDLLLIKMLRANEIVLSGTLDFNSNHIDELFLNNLQMINRKVELIKNVW